MSEPTSEREPIMAIDEDEPQGPPTGPIVLLGILLAAALMLFTVPTKQEPKRHETAANAGDPVQAGASSAQSDTKRDHSRPSDSVAHSR